MDPTTLQQKIHESLDNALQNGYDNILTNEVCDIAEDISEYDSQFEDIEPKLLEPHIKTWQDAQSSTTES